MWLSVIAIGCFVLSRWVRQYLIKDFCKHLAIGDAYIDPYCNKFKPWNCWLEHKIIAIGSSTITCERYWRTNGGKPYILPVCEREVFTHKQFYEKFNNYN